MKKPLAFMAQARKRGKPYWGSLVVPVANLPTKFEEEVERLGLKPEGYINSADLRAWCRKNRDRSYIPERLLNAWASP